MRHRSSLRMAVAAALLFPLALHAAVVLKKSFEELTSLSTVVVRGTVGQQQSRWDDRRARIHTFTEISVTERIKGEAPSTLLVRQPGGLVGNVGQRVDGTAKFTQGEDVVLFLERPQDDRGVFVVQGLAAGKVRLERNKLGETRAVRALEGLGMYEPREAKPAVEVMGQDDLGLADEFLVRIRRAAHQAVSR